MKGLILAKRLWKISEGRRLILLIKLLYGMIAWPCIALSAVLIAEMNSTKVKLMDALYLLEVTVLLLLTQLFWLELILGSFK